MSIGKTQYNYKMSIERQQRSTSFHIRQKTVKVNHNSRLLPVDFFPKINSQSPKKKTEFPRSNDALVEWFQRDESKEKPEKQFNRLMITKPSNSRISILQMNLPPESQRQKQRYVLDYYVRIKEQMKTKITPQKLSASPQKFRQRIQKNIIRRNPSISIQQKNQSRVRLIRSQSKSKRSQTPQPKSKEKNVPIERRSLRELPRRFESNQIALGFDGMVTFSRFK